MRTGYIVFRCGYDVMAVSAESTKGAGMYTGVVGMLVTVFAVVAGAYALARLVSIAASPVVSGPFLSGWRPEEHALSRYHARYYPLTLLFLAFDVEMLFMYPWATVLAAVGTSAVIEMFVLLAVLMCGVLWARREGALAWV